MFLNKNLSEMFCALNHLNDSYSANLEIMLLRLTFSPYFSVNYIILRWMHKIMCSLISDARMTCGKLKGLVVPHATEAHFSSHFNAGL